MSNIADKITKIIAKAESTTNPDEAAVFMAKANAMLEEHGIHLHDLGRLNSDDPVGVTEQASYWFAAEGYSLNMASALARYYGCKLVYIKMGNKFYGDVTGRDSARVTYQLMWPFVQKQVRQLAREMVKEGKADTKSKAQRAIGNALTLRLHGMARENEERNPVAGTGINALVPVDTIEAAMKEHYGELRSAKARSIKTNAAGKAAAGKVSVNRQTGGAGQKKLTRD